MTKKQFIGKGGETWEWTETPEVVAAVKKLHESSKKVQEVKVPRNYQGPLYAPHPDLRKKK